MTPAPSAAVRRYGGRPEPRPPALPRRSDSPAAPVGPAPGSGVPAYSPASAEQTLAGLAVEAGRLLRRRLRRAARPPRRPRLPRGTRLTRTRLALLALTAVLSLTLTWSVVDAALDHRLRLAKAEDSASSLEVSLEQRSRPRTLEAAQPRPGPAAHRARSGQPGTARGDGERGTTSRPAGGGGLEIGGPLLALLSGSGTLAAGAALGWLVLRRPPSADVDPEHDGGAPVESARSVEDDRPEPGEGRSQDDEQPAEPADEQEPLEQPGEAVSDGAGELRADELGTDEVGHDDAVDLTAGQRPLPRPRGALSEDDGLDPALAAARQRLYEKRRAPRIPVDLEGRLSWLGSQWPVTVVEISDGGLRLTAPTRPTVDGRRSPLSAGDHVRLSFPGVSGPVRVAGRLAWQRGSPAGFEAGLQLVPPSGEDLERLQELCTVAALTASPRQESPTRV